jgi:putative hydrolase of the HAD superfamily
MLRFVCLDWGDTLMKVFPGQESPMVDWPQVAEMPGATAMLAQLSNSYGLVLVTSGGESSEQQIRGALRRVSLDGFFERLFLSREFGLAKSDPGFYTAVAAALDCRPGQAVMVGDSYENDVVPAKKAGLLAVWYTPGATGKPAPPGGPDKVKPDAIVLHLAELPAALTSLRKQARPCPDRRSS